MSSRITADHLARTAVVYVRQSTMAQVTGNLESQRRQYDLAETARATGFAAVTVIDDDLGRSGSGRMQRPGFERLVALVCSASNEAVLLIHWTGGRHTEVRVPRVRTGRYPDDRAPTAVDALRKLAGHWPDRELAVSLNRMRCKTGDGETWTTVRVKEMRERLGLADYDPDRADGTTISLMKAAERLGICVGSATTLVRRGILPATQIVPGSPWLVPVEALSSEPVRQGVQRVIARRPKLYEDYQYDKVVRLPGL